MSSNPLPPKREGQYGYDYDYPYEYGYEYDYEYYEQHLALTILIVTFTTLIVLGTLFGNILTIVAVVKEDSLRNVGNSFIVSLAVADLLLAIVVMPFDVVENITGYLPVGSVGCFFYASNDVLFCTASVLNITCISIDRYIAITDSFALCHTDDTQSCRNYDKLHLGHFRTTNLHTYANRLVCRDILYVC